jgi:Kef-type K+ transport system membrane component KefB
MGIGGSIFLIAVGAIIAFGVTNQNLGPFDLTVIGWVLMLAGVAGMVITLWVWNSRKRRVVAVSPTQRVEHQQVVETPRGETVRRETVAEENWTQAPPERHYQ